MIKPLYSYLAALAVALLPATASDAPVTMKAERVALFKNGYACIEMQGRLHSGESRQQLQGLPAPVVGTLWWHAPVDIARFEARERELKMPAPVCGLSDLLRANVGKFATIGLQNGRVCLGLIALTDNRDEESGGAFVLPQASDGQKSASQPLSHIALYPLSGGSIVVPVRDIVSVDIPADEQPGVVESTVKQTVLEVTLADVPEQEHELVMGGMAYGLSWLPSYSLMLDGDRSGGLVCKATVVNDLMDLFRVQLELVSGYPAMGNAEVEDPLTHNTTLAGFLKAVHAHTQEEESSLMTNSLVTASYAEYVDSGDGFSRGMAAMAAGELIRAEDLAYYSLPDFTCRRGETVQCKLFDAAVNYEHVYTCALPNQSEMTWRSRRGEPIATVWHCLHITNTSELPWSAGVVTCYAGGRLVARSTLPYTPAGHDTQLRLSRSFDAAVSCREDVSAAAPAADDPRVMKTTYTGEIVVTNKADKPIVLELSKAIDGSVVKVSDGATVSSLPTQMYNPRSTVVWKLNLAPGEEKKCTYSYTFESQ